jgi:hypothetical protein
MAERLVTDGGRDLRVLIDREKISVPDWCEKHGLDRIRIQRLLNGSLYKRVTVDLAFTIERVTRGRVRAARFMSSTAKPFVSRHAA